MAFTTKSIPYTPFNKTSFDFGAGEITNTTSTNALTHAKVTITAVGGTHWDDTGHIDTTGASGCIPSWNKRTKMWTIEGTVACVDAVLDTLHFFPPDYQAVRDWDAVPYKENVANGNYIDEDPEDTAEIPDSVFTLTVYDIGNGTASPSPVDSWTLTLDPDQPTFDKQRPYWITVPPSEDLGGVPHQGAYGSPIDFGTIDQKLDTDALTITCQFYEFDSEVTYNESNRGAFTGGDVFIGNKKPGTTDNATQRINFTGTKAEVQNYIDNITYGSNGNDDAFDMRFKITNGVVGSYVTKHVWFSDARIGVDSASVNNTLTYSEDIQANWDLGAIVTSNLQADSDSYTATITLDSVGISGVDTFTTTTSVVSKSYDAVTGELVITDTSESNLLASLRTLQFTPEPDFTGSLVAGAGLNKFNMTLVFSHTGVVNNSTYTSVAETIVVTSTPSAELTNRAGVDRTYIEDTQYDFSSGIVPQINHPHIEPFVITFTMTSTAGTLGIGTGSGATLANPSSGTYTLSGSKTQINTALNTLYYIPAPDYFASHTINFWLDRTSGNQEWDPLEGGSFSMVSSDVLDYSITQLTGVDWLENVSKDFDSGLAITDIATDSSSLPAYQSTYTVSCKMLNSGGSDFTDGTLVTNTLPTAPGTTSGTGHGSSSPYLITGTKAEINTALADMRFIPDPNYYGVGPEIWYTITRTYDGGNLGTYNSSTKTTFNSSVAEANYSITQLTGVDWTENISKDFDSGFVITDTVTENSDYSAWYGTNYTLDCAMWTYNGSAWVEFTDGRLVTNSPGNLSTSGTGQGDTDKLLMTGTKAELNTAIADMRFIPDPDFETTLGMNIYYRLTRLQDNPDLVIVNQTESNDPTQTEFNAPTTTPSYTALSVPTSISWNEDEPEDFNSSIIITDTSTDNSDYGSLHLTNYTITARAKYDDGSSLQPLTTASWSPTSYGSASVSGTGTVSSPLIISGTKANLQTAMANLRMTPDLDWNDSPQTDGGFLIEYKIDRNESDPITAGSFVIGIGRELTIKTVGTTDFTFIGAANNNVGTVFIPTGVGTGTGTAIEYPIKNILNYTTDSSTFVGGTAIDPYYSTVTPSMSYTEDTDSSIFNGKTVGVTETASQYTSGIEYTVDLEIIPNSAGKWTGTTLATKSIGPLSVSGINSALQALQVTPELDRTASFDIEYSQTRHQTGVADVNQTPTPINIGTVSGTASPLGEYYTSVTGMSYLEDTPKTIFNGLDIGITDVAGDNYPSIVTYEVAVKLSVSTAGTWTGTTNHIKTLTGTKAVVNAALQSLLFTPTMDHNTSFDILYSQDRYVDSVLDTTHQYSDVNIGTVGATASPLGDYYTSVTGMTYLEDIPKTIFDGKDVGVTDIAADNYSDITYSVDLEISPNSAGTWASTGNSSYTLTGTKASINTAIQSLIFTPTRDSAATFNILYSQDRYVNTVLDTTHQYSDEDIAEVTGTASPGGNYSWSGPYLYHWEDTPKKIFNGTNLAITDIAADNYSDITYEVTLSLSDDGVEYATGAAGEWEAGSGNHITTFTGTKAVVNAAIQNVTFAPTRDRNVDFYVLYTQKRFVGTTPVLDTTHATRVNLGVVNSQTHPGSSEYHATVSGSFTEDTPSQYILSGFGGITDIAGDAGKYIDITYEVIVEISDSTAGVWTGTSSHIKTLTGTKSVVNAALQNLAFTPSPDYDSNFNIIYSQKRFVGATPVLDGTHATNETLGQWTATPVTEYTYGTANSNIQYMVEDGQVGDAGQTLSPKNLTEATYFQKTWQRPITITDLYEDGGGASQYKIVFTGNPSGTTLYDEGDNSFNGTYDWNTKTNIHTKLDQGIRVSGATGDFTLSFTLHRKTSDGTEKQLDSGTLSYLWLGNLIFSNSTIVVDGFTTPSTIYESTPNYKHNSQYVYDQGVQLNAGDTLYAVNEMSDFVIDFGKFTSFSNTYSYPTGMTQLSDVIWQQYPSGTLPGELISGDWIYDFIYPDITIPSHWTIEKSYDGDIGRIVIKLDNMSSSTVTTVNIVVKTLWGSLNTISVNLNQTLTSEMMTMSRTSPDGGYDSQNNPDYFQDMGYLASNGGMFYFPYYIGTGPTTPVNLRVLKQSNYWDGTRLGVNFSKMSTTEVPSDGHGQEWYRNYYWDVFDGYGGGSNDWYPPMRNEDVFEESYELISNSTNITHKTQLGPWNGWDRCINSGPQGHFYGFRAVVGKRSYESLNSGFTWFSVDDFGGDSDVIIDMVIASDPATTGADGDTRIGWNPDTEAMIHNETFTGQTAGTMEYARHTVKTNYWSRPTKMGIGPTGNSNDGSEVWFQSPVGNQSGSQYQYINDMYSPAVYVQEVKYDSTNENIYVLCILEQEDNAKYAVISKLNWSGTAYAWSTVKSIQLGTSTDHYGIEAYLSDNFETLVTIQHQYTNSTRTVSSGNSRIKIYDKDQGGTDVWGEAASQTWSMATGVTNDYGTSKISGRSHDVDYCAYNGVDTIITQGGHHVFQKNQGGTNNWGENTSTGIVNVGEGIYKYTADYLVCVGDDWAPNAGYVISGVRNKFFLFNHSLNRITSITALDDLVGSDTYYDADDGYITSEVNLIEASREHNIVGVLFEFFKTSMGLYKKIKMFTLTT